MIKIRFNPKSLTREGQIVKNAVFIPQHTVLFYVQTYDFDWHNCDFIVNGRAVKSDEIVKDGDEIIIRPAIEAPLIAVYAAWSALAWYSQIYVVLTIASTLYSIYSAITNKPKKPSFGSIGTGIDSGSPTYGFDGLGNTSEVGVPIGIVYGEHRVGGQTIGRYVNTDGDLNYLNVLLALGEGEIDSVSNLQINSNPVENYSSVSYETKLGTNTQTPISNFRQTHNTRAVAVTLLQSSAQVYTTLGTNLNALEIHLLLQNGLFASDPSTGNIISWTVTYKIEYKLHAAGSYTDLGNVDISARSRTSVRRVYRIDGLTAGQYDIRITKQSADSDFNHTGDLTWDTVDEITDEAIGYVNTALLSVTALATNQLSGSQPTITSVVKGKKISQPRVMNGGSEVDWEDYYYDPDLGIYRLFSDGTHLTWDGSTYVTKWSANPVWCLMDLILNTRYGLGNYIDSSMINLASFVAMSQYCDNRVADGNGGYEKRYNMNVVLDASTKSFDMLVQLAGSFRGLLLYSNGTIKLKIDKVETPVQLFGMGNIQESNFIQTWISQKQRHNVIEVQFLNKDIDYAQDTVVVIDEASIAAGDPIRKKQMRVFTTQTSQAIREGRFILWVEKYIKRSISFRAGIDAIVCEAGDVINVSHDVPAWGNSGRVQAGSTTTIVKLDQTVVLQSGITYRIMVRNNADDTIEERTVTTPAGSVTQVTVSSAFSSAPAAYDVFSIGQINIETKPFRITSIQTDNEHNVDIEAIEYNASVYDDSAPALPTISYSALSLGISNVTDLALTSGVVRLADGTIASSIGVWFSKPEGTSLLIMYQKARIFISDNDGASWQMAGETNDNHFEISNGIIDGTTYKIAVVSIGADGSVNPILTSPQQSILSVGKSAAPSDVPSFLVNQNRDSLFFGWSEVDDVDLAGYEIRYGESWDAGKVLATQVKHSNYQTPNITIASGQKFFIKAIDTSGNYSETEAEAIITVSSIPFQNIISSFMEAAAWSGTNDSTVVVSSVLLVSTGVLTGTYTTPVRDLGFVATFKIGINTVVVDAGGDRRFDDDTTTQFDTDDQARFVGQEVAGAVSFEINTSDDNITYNGWQPYQLGDYRCRYFKIRLTLSRASTGQDIQLSVFDYFADLPDVDDYNGSLTVSVAATGLAVTFGKTYHQAPSVQITILSGSGVYSAFSVAPDTSGFTVKLYNAAGTAQTGTFSYHAHGV